MIDTQHNTITLETRYKRAAKLQNAVGNMRSVVLNATVLPHWLNDKCFWYRRETHSGVQFQLVDAKAGTNEPAFDHQALAAALSETTEQIVSSDNLPITKVIITLSPRYITFTAFEKAWCFAAEETLTSLEEDPAPSKDLLVSPDGTKAAFVRDYNLWIRNSTTGEEHALTHDGVQFNEYAGVSRAWGVQYHVYYGIQALWSPDSKQLFTVQVDNRQVKSTPIISHVPKDGSIRPVLTQSRIGFAGDEYIETNRIVAIDVEGGTIQAANYRQVPTNRTAFGIPTDGLAWWRNDSRLA